MYDTPLLNLSVYLSEYDTESLFFMDTERFAVFLHLLNILLLLFHMWHLSVISSCRKFFDSGSEKEHRILFA
uniref:Uncharacterized protein n=1 Tax=Pristionchus pacificus TaxID=54126 RepID=A0A2A6BYV4_PRIPA|eukprot:PDM71049.1 hypothetical protein PRIPAC_44445 [Pristionchus pacificus]